ncbi:hypothetical protein LSTR_LSTR003740, partial [Laodelphax striatellus]
AVIAIWFLGVATRQEVIGIGKYPLQVHRMYRERVAEGLLGIWSQWSSWSECSRSCGGGISTQTRECRPRIEGRHKRKVSGGHCIGMYKRMHICNTQECPAGSVDFRRVQCEAYNGKLFMGRAYTWEPFTDAGNECALNCRALGYRFYATLNNSVADGTSCRPSSKDRATRAMCIGGMCKRLQKLGLFASCAIQRIPGTGKNLFQAFHYNSDKAFILLNHLPGEMFLLGDSARKSQSKKDFRTNHHRIERTCWEICDIRKGDT